MKKIILLPLLLAACAGTSDTDTIVKRLTSEPKGCEFLYTMDSSVTDYDIDNVYNFVEERILDRDSLGNSYYVSELKKVENKEAILGPKYTYKLKTKVYNCKN